MDSQKIISIIRKTIQESGRQFYVNYLDDNGFPHSSAMGFVHLNKNMSLIMLIPKQSRKASVLFEHPWIEAVFQTKDFRFITKFYGRAFLTSSQKSVEKLLKGYPFLSEYFPQSGTGALLLQLQTQMIEIEWLEEGAKWHSRENYICDGVTLKETDNPVIEGPKISVQEKNMDAFDLIRKQLTKSHGEMLMHLMSADYDEMAAFIAEEFSSDKYPDKAAYAQYLSSYYKDVEWGSSDFNWGIRDFEENKDGTVTCHYFLDVSTGEDSKFANKQVEQWVNEGGSWKLLKVT